MSELLSALLAAGFGLGLSATSAQDVKSDQSKADHQEQMMQQKEQGTSKAEHAGHAIPNGAQGHQSDTDTSLQPDGRTTPPQSMPSLGHPKEGAVTGQFGVKKLDESGQLDQSTSGMSDQSSSNGPDRRITPN